MAQRTFKINRVKSLPTTGSNGDWYILEKPNGRFEVYIVNPRGELVFNKGITDEQNARLERMSSEQISKVESITTGDINKLKQDYTKAEIDQQFLDVKNLANSSRINLNGSTVLPVPPRRPDNTVIEDAWVRLAQNVTYTQTGGDPLTGIDGHETIAEWNNEDGEWVLVDLGEMPGKEPTDEYDIETDRPLSGIAIGKGISRGFRGGEDNIGNAEDVKELNRRVNFIDRPDIPYGHYILGSDQKIIDRLLSENRDAVRLLPIGMSVSYIDRPDLDVIIIIDKENRIISHSNQNRSNNGGLPIGMSVFYVDRPDLGTVIIVDKENRIISHTGQGQGQGGGGSVVVSEVQSNFAPWNPPEQESFRLTRSIEALPENVNSRLANYGLLISDYDALMAETNVNPNFGIYVTKSEIGRSGVGDIPIWKYSFRPPQPKAKVLLIAGSHAIEKMYIECIYQFAKALCKDWGTNDFLGWLRWNVHIDILPCRSPATISNPAGFDTTGDRSVPETDPIPFSWTRSGTTITLTFDVADFPQTSDGFLTGDTYFNSVPASALVDKTFISIRQSSDEDAIPIAIYRIGSVISGNSITFNVEDASGSNSGTGQFQVWTDPMRGGNIPDTTLWEDFTPRYSPNTMGEQRVTFDNKGTRPFALQENRVLLKLWQDENYDLHIDGHADAADNDFRYDSKNGFAPDIERMLAETAAFNNSTSNIRDEVNILTPYLTTSISRIMNKPATVIEWGSGFARANETQVRDALRWLGITLKNIVIKIINDKNK